MLWVLVGLLQLLLRHNLPVFSRLDKWLTQQQLFLSAAMPPANRDAALAQLESELLRQTGVSDKTLAAYLLSLGAKGSAQVRQELADFPQQFIDTIATIIESFYAPAPASFELNAFYSVVVKKTAKFGVFVRVLEPPELRAKEGLIHSSELGGNLHLKPGDTLKARLIKLDGDKLSFSVKTRQSHNPDDAFELQQLAASGLAVEQPIIEEIAPATPKSDVDVELRHNVPAFLRNETLEPPASTQQTQSELSKAARYTAGKISELRLPAETLPGLERTSQSSKSSASRPTPKVSESRHLPVYAFQSQIVEAIKDNRVVIIVGDTGSGKTTQITQYMYAAGFADNGKVIACTQPRRIAAISISQRVASEMQAKPVGGLVGYAVRFDDNTSPNTRIKYMTDGLLQREVAADPDLKDYSVIMLDEAHERTVATDVLFALLKGAMARRPDLHIIVTSATLDAERFAAYFGGAPVLRIPGRTFPVNINWLDVPVLDYMESALGTVKRIHEEEPRGDILVFLTGQAEIDLAAASVAKIIPDGSLIPVPVYAALPSEQQQHIFEPAPASKRKVVFATNIAETSLTIDGIRYVVDTGFAKVQVWDAKQGMDVLKIVPISQAQANQRSGRAGRTAPGVCYRLYTEHAYVHEMPKSTVPEIQRQNLSNVALQLKAMGINDVLNVDFLDAPPRSAFVSSLYDLYLLGALDDDGNLTPLGVQMAAYPIEPAMARVLLASQRFGEQCTEDLLTIIAMMSMPSVFYRPTNPPARQAEADRMHRRLHDYTGDHLTLLNTYERWREANFSRKWCENNYLHFRTLLKVRDARAQLADLVRKSRHKARPQEGRLQARTPKEMILKALCTGYFRNIARADGNAYKLLSEEMQVSMHPSSVLHRRRVEYVLYNSLVLTTREYMHTVSQVQAEWLVEMAPDFFRASNSDDLRKRRRKEKLTPLFNKRATHENEWRISAQQKTLYTNRRR